MKYSQIRIWPETVGHLPAQTALISKRNIANDLLLDWTNCTEVDSTGLTFLLARLLKFLFFEKNQRRWKARMPLEPKISDRLDSLAFWQMLNLQSGGESQSEGLFPIRKPENCHVGPITSMSSMGVETISIPIYRLAFTSQMSNRREEVEKFGEWVYRELIALRKDFLFHHTQLTMVLVEMAKNSADHTEGDAYFGMDIHVSPTKEQMMLTFAFADLGDGIKQHIQGYHSKKLKKRIPHFSIYEAYYFALKPGFSTNNGTLNKGVGMSLILEGSKGMNLELSVFDGDSRGLLSRLEGRSHAEIRRVFFDLGTKVGFYYFGKLIAGAS
jgi:hypothetical protein